MKHTMHLAKQGLAWGYNREHRMSTENKYNLEILKKRNENLIKIHTCGRSFCVNCNSEQS